MTFGLVRLSGRKGFIDITYVNEIPLLPICFRIAWVVQSFPSVTV